MHNNMNIHPTRKPLVHAILSVLALAGTTANAAGIRQQAQHLTLCRANSG